jgi:8-oxo-dGTP diphosphatase
VGHVRLSVKAIIVQGGRLLAVRNRDELGDWYLLPGGGQEVGETVDAALRRECIEEIGCEVRRGRLRYIRDYIGRNHEFAATDADSHQVELMFECDIAADPVVGTRPDVNQTGVEWLPLASLGAYRLYPSALCTLIPNADPADEALYLGDVN